MFCQQNCRQLHAEPLKLTVLPERPWVQIGMDLCYLDGKDYLIVIDYFSRWLEIVHLQDTTTVIRTVKNLFARRGIPEVVRSDNGPQFTSSLFKAFAEEYKFLHTTSHPHYPQGNGVAERAVQTAKRILKQEDPFLTLMEYRPTPIETTGCSSAQLIMGRNIRTRLPVIKSELYPKWPELVKVAEKDADAKKKSMQNYSWQHGTRELFSLLPGNTVQIQNPMDKTWETEPRKIESKISGRSYNRRHVRPIILPPSQPIERQVQEERQDVSPNSSFEWGTPIRNINVPHDLTPGPLVFRDEVDLSVSPEIKTRSGRVVRKVQRLDL